MPSDNPFKWRQFEPALILQCVRWYLRYALSYRDLEDMMRERGLCVDHTTTYRWVQRYAPEIDKRCRPFLRRTNDSYRIDETYVRVAGAWTYLYRGAVASVCRTVDRHAATRMRGSAAVLVGVGLGRQTGGLPGLLQCASGPCVVGRADARPDTKGCRTARPLPMGRALPWSLSDADRGVTSDQRRRWRAGRRARVRRLSRHSRAVRQLHALLMPSRQRRGGLPAHGTRRSNDVGFLRIRHPHVLDGGPGFLLPERVDHLLL